MFNENYSKETGRIKDLKNKIDYDSSLYNSNSRYIIDFSGY